MPKGEYTRAAKIAKAEATEEKWTMLRLALYYALGHDIGACAVVSTKLFPGVTKMMVHNAINGRVKALLGVRYQSDVLTKEEELKLCDWIAACARGKDPVKDGAVGEEGGGIGIGQGDARCLRALPPAVCVRRPCPMIALELCLTCGDVKKSVCALPEGGVCGGPRPASANDARGGGTAARARRAGHAGRAGGTDVRGAGGRRRGGARPACARAHHAGDSGAGAPATRHSAGGARPLAGPDGGLRHPDETSLLGRPYRALL